MKILGIVAEYNPFHRGHKLHIEESKAISGADFVIVVMSGSFVQRGEPAIVDKWIRTKMALLNGADLVLELPVLYAVSSAEYFAHAAVKLLHDTGIVDCISFGAEAGQIEPLRRIAELLTTETAVFSKLVKNHLALGKGYAAARAAALTEILPEYASVLSSPNNILGIEYIKALNRLQSSIVPLTIQRKGGGYHDDSLETNLASASAIRKGILEKGISSILPQLPENTHSFFNAVFQQGGAPLTLDDFSEVLSYQLRRMPLSQLAEVLEVTEGLENRIKRCMNTCFSITQLSQCVKTKRYTLSKIQRILIHALLDIKTDHLLDYNQNGYSPYMRVLGFRKSRQNVLKMLSENARIPLLTNLKYAPSLLDQKGLALLQMETRATDIYFGQAPSLSCRMANQDYTRPMVIIP